jgi:hypothetical protein
LTEDEQKVYDFIKEITNVFGEDVGFIAKGSLGVFVKTSNYIHTKSKHEIIPYVKPKQVEKVKKK